MKQNSGICVQWVLSGNGEEEKYITEAQVAVPNGIWGESKWKYCEFLGLTSFLIVVCSIIVNVSLRASPPYVLLSAHLDWLCSFSGACPERELQCFRPRGSGRVYAALVVKGKDLGGWYIAVYVAD